MEAYRRSRVPPALADNAVMAHDLPLVGATPAGHLVEADLQSVLGYQMAQASVVMDRVYEQAVGAPRNLHRVEYTLLMLVGANPGCTAAKLARALGMSTPNMTLWLDRVAGKGLLDRTPSASDRRANHLRLTPRGEETARDATQAIRAAEEALLSALSPAERMMLAELLHKAAACRTLLETP
jgi:DNA-binding MarR family transcriptional regulator